MIEAESIARSRMDIEMIDGVVESARGMDNRQRAINRCSHLRQTTGLEQRRHEHKVGACIAHAREAFIKVHYRHPSVQAEGADDLMEIFLMRTIGDDRDL